MHECKSAAGKASKMHASRCVRAERWLVRVTGRRLVWVSEGGGEGG